MTDESVTFTFSCQTQPLSFCCVAIGGGEIVNGSDASGDIAKLINGGGWLAIGNAARRELREGRR
jgi:hypothetical protein